MQMTVNSPVRASLSFTSHLDRKIGCALVGGDPRMSEATTRQHVCFPENRRESLLTATSLRFSKGPAGDIFLGLVY